MKLHKDMISWGGPNDNNYCIWWFNSLPKNIRYLGFKFYWYDGPINSIGFWFFDIGWVTPFFMYIPKNWK
jgi:hypothetical protein